MYIDDFGNQCPESYEEEMMTRQNMMNMQPQEYQPPLPYPEYQSPPTYQNLNMCNEYQSPPPYQNLNMCNNDMHIRGYKENYQINIEPNKLLILGFSQEEIIILKNSVDMYGYISNQKLSSPPFCITDIVLLNRLMYAYNISMGKVIIDTSDIIGISKHMRKISSLHGGHPTFSCFNVKHRNINNIPRVAVVVNLPKGNFYSLNSTLYDNMENSYKVDKIAQEWVTIYSDRKMAVGHADRLNNSVENREWGIEGLLKVEEVGSFDEGRPWKIKIHKKNCLLCNRFMIIVTTRKVIPWVTQHHGGYEVVTEDGTILYIYARTTEADSYGNPKDTVPNTTNDTVAVDYGFYSNEIKAKLDKAVLAVQSVQRTVYINPIQGETDFNRIAKYIEKHQESNQDTKIDDDID